MLAGTFLHLSQTYTYYWVTGNSMNPALKSGEMVAVTKEEELLRDQLVFFKKPERWRGRKEKETMVVKRLAGLPGDTLTYHNREFVIGDRRYPLPDNYPCKISNLETTIPEDSYFLLGDNEKVSLDSRYVFCHDSPQKSFVPKTAIKAHGVLAWATKGVFPWSD